MKILSNMKIFIFNYSLQLQFKKRTRASKTIRYSQPYTHIRARARILSKIRYGIFVFERRRHYVKYHTCYGISSAMF